MRTGDALAARTIDNGVASNADAVVRTDDKEAIVCARRFSISFVVLAAFFPAGIRAEEGGAASSIARESTATLTGRILYDGEPPEPALLEIPLRLRVRHEGLEFDTEELPGRRRMMEDGIRDESLIIGVDGGIANVVVWLTSKDVPIPKPPSKQLPPVTLRAVNGRLIPHVLAFWNMRVLELVNDCGEPTHLKIEGTEVTRQLVDDHKVEIKFNSAMPRPLPVTSNTHPWFRAHVLAMNHPYFAVTDDGGRFTIADLPPGEWKFAMWHERHGYLRSEKFPSGRFELGLHAGNHDIGEVKVDAAPRLAAREMRLEMAGRDLFLRDPQRPARAALQVRPFNALSDLHQAVMGGDVQRVGDLLRVGLNVNSRESRFNCTPLHYAARHGHVEIVRTLVEKGASVDARDINNCTPLMWAAKGGHAGVVRALLDAKAKIDARDNRDWTALHFALDRGHGDTAQLLIERGADREAKNRDGKTPLELRHDIQVGASP
jgi:hypothetical protein